MCVVWWMYIAKNLLLFFISKLTEFSFKNWNFCSLNWWYCSDEAGHYRYEQDQFLLAWLQATISCDILPRVIGFRLVWQLWEQIQLHFHHHWEQMSIKFIVNFIMFLLIIVLFWIIFYMCRCLLMSSLQSVKLSIILNILT